MGIKPASASWAMYMLRRIMKASFV